MTTTELPDDIIAVLTERHTQLRDHFTRVENATPTEIIRTVGDLRRALQTHESAEARVVHVALRRTNGDLADTFLIQERDINRLVIELQRHNPWDPHFLTRIHALRDTVTEHLNHEERDAFPILETLTPDQRTNLAHAYLRLEARNEPPKPR